MKNALLYVGILLSVLFLTSCAHCKGRKLPPQARNLLPPQLRNLSNQQLADLGNDAEHLQHFALLQGINGLNGLNGIDPRALQGINFQGVPLSPFWKKALEKAGTPGVFTPEDEKQVREASQDLMPHWKMDHSDSSSLATVRTVSEAIQHRESDTH